MSMNEKAIVGETFDDLSDQEMAMLTGRGDAEPYSFWLTVCITEMTVSVTAAAVSLASCKK